LQVRSEKDKTTMKEETKRIQKEFKNQLGPHVDNPKQGCRKKKTWKYCSPVFRTIKSILQNYRHKRRTYTQILRYIANNIMWL